MAKNIANTHHVCECPEFYRIFTFRFSFWALFDTTALMNLFESMVFLIIQDLRSKFTIHGSVVFTLKIHERQTPIAQLE